MNYRKKYLVSNNEKIARYLISLSVRRNNVLFGYTTIMTEIFMSQYFVVCYFVVLFRVKLLF